MYLTNTWLQRRGGRAPLFAPELWSQYNAVMEDKPQTNNSLERFNRTWNSLVGNSSSVWTVQEVFVKRDAEARRNFLNNAVGQDIRHNTGNRQRSLDSIERIKYVVQSFNSMPRKDYISVLAHDLQKYDK